jgi:Ca-activated chloride channel family protein
MGDALMQAIDLAAPVQQPDGSATPGPNGSRTPTATPTPVKSVDPKAPPAVIVLLSDGANSLGQTDPIDAAGEAQARGIPIFTIALGTPSGIVEVTQNGITQRVRVPPDEDTLKQISDLTEGKFYSAPSASQLTDIYKALGSKIGYNEEDREITAAFAAAALAFLVAGAGFSLFWFNKFP